MNINRVILVGNVAADPESRMTQSGTAVTNFRMATNRVYTDRNGEKQEQTEFHRVVAWARLAEIVRDYLVKGQLVAVEGRIQTRSFEGRDGQKRWITEIVADAIQLGPKAGQRGGQSQGSSQSAASSSSQQQKSKNEKKDEDIPVIEEDTPVSFDEEENEKEINPDDIPF